MRSNSILSVQVPTEVDDAIRQVADKEQLSKSDMLRRFIREGLDRIEKPAPRRRHRRSSTASA